LRLSQQFAKKEAPAAEAAGALLLQHFSIA